MCTETKPKSGEDSDESESDKSTATNEKGRSYYYDDAHGYEEYYPESEDDEELDD